MQVHGILGAGHPPWTFPLPDDEAYK